MFYFRKKVLVSHIFTVSSFRENYSVAVRSGTVHSSVCILHRLITTSFLWRQVAAELYKFCECFKKKTQENGLLCRYIMCQITL